MVQEHLTEGTRELPQGKEIGRERPYTEKVSRDLRTGWLVFTALSGNRDPRGPEGVWPLSQDKN